MFVPRAGDKLVIAVGAPNYVAERARALIRRSRLPEVSLRRTVLCTLPAELSPALQAFIGFVVVTLWKRAAAAASG